MSKEITKAEKREVEQTQSMQEEHWSIPPVDIYENDEELLLIADLPGVKKENLRVEFSQDQILIEGRHSGVPEGVAMIGGSPQNYRRVFALRQPVDTDKATAELKRGVLTLHMPKPESMKPRQIQVTAG